jgi:hypothetical protein
MERIRTVLSVSWIRHPLPRRRSRCDGDSTERKNKYSTTVPVDDFEIYRTVRQYNRSLYPLQLHIKGHGILPVTVKSL